MKSSSTNLVLRKKLVAPMPRVKFDGKDYDPTGYARWCIDNAPASLNSCSVIETIINCLGNLKERNVTNDEKFSEIIDGINDMEHLEKRNFHFFTAQLSLILVKDPTRRRYCDLLTMACDLLTMACMWQNVSPALYKQIKSESILTLRTSNYVRSSGLDVGAGYEMSDVTRALPIFKQKRRNYQKKM